MQQQSDYNITTLQQQVEEFTITTTTSLPLIDHSELAAFEHLHSFNLFLYSPVPNSKPVFLLSKPTNTPNSTFTHCSGTVTKHDPNIFFSVIREFITQNRGLLQHQNLSYLKASSPMPLNEENLDDGTIRLEAPGKVRPQRGLTKSMDDICGLLAECPHIFQDKSGTVSYFIEMPLLNLEVVNRVAKVKGLGFEMGYFSFDDILGDFSNEGIICPKLKEILQSNRKLLAYARRFIEDGEQVEIREHYGIMSCEPKFDNFIMHALHYSIYKKHGEKWTLYKAFKGEFPSDEELKRFKGFLIPGSSCSAYADFPWYKNLFERINKIVYEHQEINLLLVCFGAQVTAQALGGKVEKMKKPFIRGQDELMFNKEFYEHEYIRKAGLDPNRQLFIAQSHGDHIVELPPRAVRHGTSVSTEVEVYTIGSQVLAFQGHPEYTEAWTAGANYRVNGLQVEDYDLYAEEYMKEKFPSPVSREELLRMCFTFLKKDSCQKSGSREVSM